MHTFNHLNIIGVIATALMNRKCVKISVFIVCACAILKDRPVCYGTSRLKSRVCAVTWGALLKTPTLKSNKR